MYHAVHPRIGSRVAIKVLSYAGAESPATVERFFTEARAVNLIRHEHIVNVLDMSTLPDGRPFIVMEYLHGKSLSDVIRAHGALPLGWLSRFAVEVLGALGRPMPRASSTATSSRTICSSPRRVGQKCWISASPSCAPRGPSAPRPRTGALLGTPHYMSPEQAGEEPVGPASDLYSLGIILYEGLTGSRPFTAPKTLELLREHLVTPPPPPRERRPDLPAALEAVVLRALAKRPEDRFASAAEMAGALESAVAELGHEAFAPLAVEEDAGAEEPASATAPGPEASPPPTELGATAPIRRSPPVVAPPGATPAPGPQPQPSLELPERAPAPRRARLAVIVVLVLAAASAAAIVLWSRLGRRRPPAAAGAPQRALASDAGAADRDATAAEDADTDELPSQHLHDFPDEPHVPFNVLTGLGLALGYAREVVADVELVHFTAEGVGPKGMADLATGGRVEYTFRSPSRSPFVPGAPERPRPCLIVVIASRYGIDRVELPDRFCDEPPVRRPDCALATVWKRLLGPQARPDQTVSVRYYLSGTPAKPRWVFDEAPGVARRRLRPALTHCRLAYTKPERLRPLTSR